MDRSALITAANLSELGRGKVSKFAIALAEIRNDKGARADREG